jgi:hypothetical protein
MCSGGVFLFESADYRDASKNIETTGMSTLLVVK